MNKILKVLKHIFWDKFDEGIEYTYPLDYCMKSIDCYNRYQEMIRRTDEDDDFPYGGAAAAAVCAGGC